MADVSVIIPGRCETYFQQTIDSVLAAARGDIEVIPVIDGYEPDPPLVINDDRVKPIYLEKSIGQRAAYNLGVKNSTGRFVMKLDAHAMPSDGFDVELASHCPDKTIVLPIMRRLDVNRWKPKITGKTLFMYFGLDVYCHYWNEYKKRPEAQVEYPEVLTGQGSCWFTTRDWNDYIGLLDENLGSWGKVGIEVSLKTWLCGGRQVVNKKAWQAHWFRVSDGGFPYPMSGRQIGRVRDLTFQNFFFKDNGAFPNQVRPFSWLIKKFAPIPGWEAYLVDEYKSNRVILYYTDSQLEESLAGAVRKNLATAAGPIPIISVSQKPLQFGQNIVVGPKPRTAQSMYEQILTGAEQAPEKSIVYLCEHDVFYHPSHFAKLPKDDRAFYFNQNRYYWWVGDTAFYKAGNHSKALSQAVVNREYLIEHVKARLANWSPNFKVRRYQWHSERPNVDVRHGQNLTGDGAKKKRILAGDGEPVYNIGGWGGTSHFQTKAKYKGTMRWDVVQYLINLYKYQSYLEIGVDRENTWKHISCELKHGVDPARGGTHRMTSDEFFRRFYDCYDLIFIDGLHEAPQATKDVENALRHLNKDGVIVMHDCYPRNEAEQMVPKPEKQRIWTGDVWKAFVTFRRWPNLSMYVVDTNNGLGVIRLGKQAPLVINNPTYADFEKNKTEWLNLKTVTEFRTHERKLACTPIVSG